MAESPQPRGRLLRRWGSFPSERDWERSVLLEPLVAPYEPDLISDGAGLPFPPAALGLPAGLLDTDDPPVAAFAAQLSRQKPAPDGTVPHIREWRILTRTADDVLFARGMPPRMVTVALRREGRRNDWNSIAVTRAGALRTTRDGIRASSWQLDEKHPPGPGDTVIRMLVTEQTRSGGALADKRMLAPDLHFGAEEVLVTMFVTPKVGVQAPITSPVPATPVRLQLPSPLGERMLVDGALYESD